jgi:hypothetical protein
MPIVSRKRRKVDEAGDMEEECKFLLSYFISSFFLFDGIPKPFKLLKMAHKWKKQQLALGRSGPLATNDSQSSAASHTISFTSLATTVITPETTNKVGLAEVEGPSGAVDIDVDMDRRRGKGGDLASSGEED